MSVFSIAQIQLPVFIPSRNKGHADVLASCEIGGTCCTDAYAYNLIQSIIEKRKASFTIDTVKEILVTASKQYEGFKNLFLSVSFLYQLDRVSAGFLQASYELPCTLYAQVTSTGEIDYSLHSITLPIRLFSTISIPATLKFEVKNLKKQFFLEDLLDYVVQKTGTRLYPIVAEQDLLLLSGVLDKGKSLKEYTDIFLKSSGLGEEHTVSVFFTDIYSMYAITQVIKSQEVNEF